MMTFGNQQLYNYVAFQVFFIGSSNRGDGNDGGGAPARRAAKARQSL